MVAGADDHDTEDRQGVMDSDSYMGSVQSLAGGEKRGRGLLVLKR